MSKRTVSEEWYIAKDEADWARLSAPRHGQAPSAAPAPQARGCAPRFLWAVAVIVLCLASLGDWWWRTAQGRTHQVAAAATVAAPGTLAGEASGPDALVARGMRTLSDIGGWYPFTPQVTGLQAAVQNADPAVHLDVAVQAVDSQGNQAVVNIVTTAKNGAPAYRQTRCYRRTATGWVQMAPDAELWGRCASWKPHPSSFTFASTMQRWLLRLRPRSKPFIPHYSATWVWLRRRRRRSW